MKKAQSKIKLPDLTEFTDEAGKKWVQTSTEDLFSMEELNNILESIDTETESDEIVLARIDFQKVNKEYYEAALALQKKLKKQSELLKKIITDSKIKIERKNVKLKELIQYIKKLHIFIAHLNASDEELRKLKLSPEALLKSIAESSTKTSDYIPAYEEVEEKEISLDTDLKDLK